MNPTSAIVARMAKAERALESALELLETDADGACNRAYYAMFDAAQAALLASGCGTCNDIKTHSGLRTIFARDLVRAGRVDATYSRGLSRVHFLRQLADYAQGTGGTCQ